MDWKTYEETVKSIYEALGKKQELQIICYGNSCTYTGKSGITHQIDIITSHSDGIHTYTTAIECKYWNNTINKDIIMKLIEIRNDCNFDKAVVVSKTGFTPDAVQYARYNNVGLVELREAVKQDFEKRLTQLDINVYMCREEVISFANYSSDDDLNFSINIDDGYYLQPDGSLIEIRDIINTFSQEIFGSQKFDEPVTKIIKFPEGTFLKIRNCLKQASVRELLLKMILKTHEKTISLRSENYVWLVMKFIFEGKDFIISKSGKIREVPHQ